MTIAALGLAWSYMLLAVIGILGRGILQRSRKFSWTATSLQR